MRMVDDIVLDPVEIAEGRTELDLSKMGLSVIDADFGENGIEATAIRTGLGQQLVDRRPKPRTITFDLRVREDSEADLPTAAILLQRKIGTMMKRGGWLRRDFIYGNFAGSLLYKVTGEISLSNIAGWRAGDAGIDPTLSFVCDLVGYSTEEREQGPFTTSAGARHLIFTEVASPGAADGLWRCQVLNEGAEDLRGLIYSRECEYAPEELSDPTAQPAYLAKNLTPKGGAEVKTVSGAEIVEHGALTAGWITALDSFIAGVGHMTHLGPRRVWMRVQNPEPEKEVQVQLLWRALGGSRWDDLMPVVTLPAVSGWIPIDLGLALPQLAETGEQRWEFKLMARAPEGGKIRIRDVYPLSTEQYGVVREPYVAPVADAQGTKSPGTVENNASAGGTAWTNPGNAKSSDNVYATLTAAAKETAESQYLLIKKLAFALPEAATVTGIVVSVEREADSAASSHHVVDLAARIVKGGSIGTEDKSAAGYWPTSDAVIAYGSSSDLWGETWTPADINAEGFGFAVRVQAVASTAPASVTASVDAITITVYYTETVQDEDKVCYASRSIELRSNGIVRQHPTDNVWGSLVPDGFYPKVPAGGLESEPTRTILIPSAGDFAILPDGASPPPLNAGTYSRDGYLIAREAKE